MILNHIFMWTFRIFVNNGPAGTEYAGLSEP